MSTSTTSQSTTTPTVIDRDPHTSAPNCFAPTDYTPVLEPLHPARNPDAPKTPTLSTLRFNPPERVVELIIADLCAGHASLGEIASRASTSPESLILWMSRPDISERLDAMEAGLARAARLTIANRTGGVLGVCTRIIEQFNETESHFAYPENSIRGRAVSVRNRQSAIEACKLLLRLALYFARNQRTPSISERASLQRTPSVSERAISERASAALSATPAPSASASDASSVCSPAPSQSLPNSTVSVPNPIPALPSTLDLSSPSLVPQLTNLLAQLTDPSTPEPVIAQSISSLSNLKSQISNSPPTPGRTAQSLLNSAGQVDSPSRCGTSDLTTAHPRAP